ncbi:YSIRK-type signal peptide-containing protein [Staphylococcus warneri]|nr:YSIRK-type signal peptide-containing protein [Staphylococcus warneri]
MKNHLFKVNQRQRYAIRKFSVGIGSTLIGVTLFLGMQNHAHAAENSESKTQQILKKTMHLLHLINKRHRPMLN